MRRHFLSTMIAAALAPAGSVWAASNAAASATQYLNQIGQQASQIQAQADGLEAYVRSGAHDWVNSTSFTADMAGRAQRIWTLLDKVAAQPGATNDTRMQVEKMKTLTEELMAFTSAALDDLEPHGLALHADNVYANAANIEDRCNLIRGAALTLNNTH